MKYNEFRVIYSEMYNKARAIAELYHKLIYHKNNDDITDIHFYDKEINYETIHCGESDWDNFPIELIDMSLETAEAEIKKLIAERAKKAKEEAAIRIEKEVREKDEHQRKLYEELKKKYEGEDEKGKS